MLNRFGRMTFPSIFANPFPRCRTIGRLAVLNWFRRGRRTLAVSSVVISQAAVFGQVGASDLEWPVYRGDAGASQFSELAQINAANVHQLQSGLALSHG